MSLERREWYADEVYDPSPYPRAQTSFRNAQFNIPRGLGKDLMIGQIMNGPDGKPLGIVTSIGTHDPQIPPVVTLVSQGVVQVGQHIHATIEKMIGIMTSQSDLYANESARDRALRLKQQPHSMAQNPNDLHFDHYGRKRRK